MDTAFDMGSNRILHVCTLDKFIPPFIDFLESNFSDFETSHEFFLFGDCEQFKVTPRKNTFQVGERRLRKIHGYIKVVIALHKADKVVLHGLLNRNIVRLLWLMPWLLKKCYWVIWGWDLYAYEMPRATYAEKLDEFFRRPVIKRMGYLVTYIEGEVALARKWYGAMGIHQKCFTYTTNICHNIEMPAGRNNTVNIQVGNSAMPSNNHFDALNRLLPFCDQDIAIYVPLSYGDEDYARSVIDFGASRFGDKFNAITRFMPFDEYLALLGQMDVAIFNHDRQQAIGNITSLLALGKKVFLRQDVTSWTFFVDLGLDVFDVDDLDIEPLDVQTADRNRKIVFGCFSEITLVNDLEKMFYT